MQQLHMYDYLWLDFSTPHLQLCQSLFHIFSITERAAFMTYKKAAEQCCGVVSNLCIGEKWQSTRWLKSAYNLLTY
jgi:hypothetical protein